MGWNRWLGRNAHFVGMTGFGASAPAEALFPHFHITAERVAEMARSLVSSHAGASRDPTPGRD
jgi:transketolase